MSDNLLEVVQDFTSLKIGLRMIMEAAETKKIPSEGIIPEFNDSYLADEFQKTLEMVAGEEY